jgi:hypothetical protein
VSQAKLPAVGGSPRRWTSERSSSTPANSATNRLAGSMEYTQLDAVHAVLFSTLADKRAQRALPVLEISPKRMANGSSRWRRHAGDNYGI